MHTLSSKDNEITTQEQPTTTTKKSGSAKVLVWYLQVGPSNKQELIHWAATSNTAYCWLSTENEIKKEKQLSEKVNGGHSPVFFWTGLDWSYKTFHNGFMRIYILNLSTAWKKSPKGGN